MNKTAKTRIISFLLVLSLLLSTLVLPPVAAAATEDGTQAAVEDGLIVEISAPDVLAANAARDGYVGD